LPFLFPPARPCAGSPSCATVSPSPAVDLVWCRLARRRGLLPVLLFRLVIRRTG